MLFTRYGGAVQEVLSLDFEDFIEQINFAIDERSEEDIRNRWINGFQTVFSLDEFKQKINYKKPSEQMLVEVKPVEDILDDLFKNFG